jgi:hypothetical protein
MLAMAIPIISIVFGTITSYLARVRQLELEAALKQDMLARGMSAEEIRTIIEATTWRRGKKGYVDEGRKRCGHPDPVSR